MNIKLRNFFLRIIFYITFNFLVIRVLNNQISKVLYDFRHNLNNMHVLVGLTNKLPINIFTAYLLGIFQVVGIFIFEFALYKITNRCKKNS